MERKGDKSPLLSALAGQKQKLWRDQIKENRSLSLWGWMVQILKMRRFSCLLRLLFPPEMGKMAQTFISEIEWLTVSKCRATGLSTSLFLTERRCSAICQIDVGPFHPWFHRCKVDKIYCKKCSKWCWTTLRTKHSHTSPKLIAFGVANANRVDNQ